MIRKDNFLFKKSNKKNKKYDVFNLKNEYIASFGDNRYQHFKDKIGLWKHKDHNDNNRKRLYYLRHGKIAERLSPKWFSHRYLW